MFPDYEPPEPLKSAVSQAAIVAADIDPDRRSVEVAVHSETYIPQRFLNQFSKDICQMYGLRNLEVTATHPAQQISAMEPDELMQLFVSRNSMTRGSLAGAKWQWEENNLTIRLLANGKDAIEELIPQVQMVLQERFATPVTITVEAGKALEGQELFDAMESIRASMVAALPTAPQTGKPEKAASAASGDNFYGKPFKGNAVPMKDLNLDMGSVIVEGRVFSVEHKELKKRNAWVINFDMTDNTNSIRINRFMEAGEAKPILENVKVGSVLRVQGKLLINQFDNEMVLKPFSMRLTLS